MKWLLSRLGKKASFAILFLALTIGALSINGNLSLIKIKLNVGVKNFSSVIAQYVNKGLGFVQSLSKGITESLNKKTSAPQKEVWVNVFVHGTIGASLSLLYAADIRNDQIKKSSYRKMIKIMRRDPSLHQEQVILQRGFYNIVPSLSPEDFKDEEFLLGAYPLTKIYDDISNLVGLNSNLIGDRPPSIYMAYGWSGYMSQYYRRIEGIRLFNHLSVKIEELKNNGFIPKVRIFAHSHGGNVVLNAAGVYHYLQSEDSCNEFYKNFLVGNKIKEIFNNILRRLPEREVTELMKNKEGKKYDFMPSFSNLEFVDELYLLGTPIQEETAMFLGSPFFKRVVNLYSDNDVIQGLDFLSTFYRQSLQRTDTNLKKQENQLLQIRTIIKPQQQNSAAAVTTSNPAKKETRAAWWQVLLGLKDTSKKSADPTHKELWFISLVNPTDKNFLKPIPVVCFLPILIKLIEGSTLEDSDLDLIIEDQDHNIGFKLSSQTSSNIYSETIFPKQSYQDLKSKLEPWLTPKDSSDQVNKIFKKLLKIGRKLNL